METEIANDDDYMYICRNSGRYTGAHIKSLHRKKFMLSSLLYFKIFSSSLQPKVGSFLFDIYCNPWYQNQPLFGNRLAADFSCDV